ncbi:2,3-dihydro-2,3-dihydroxybenzoate dehydrogenase [Pseudonocardiaceae bacterium YIM PH 21723]|nr:2,3-dihydro-2,3-dihydroxybenzoate dehydrogenase [Pseudonocardiaceae bacterium YIM PH 21723]
MNRFDGKVALVTGAGQGIGAAVARALADHGAIVAATDLKNTERTLDVTDADAVERTVAEIEDELGPIDIVVNVAGILRPNKAIDMSTQDWKDTFAVNTDGVFHVSQAAARRMVPRNRGVIITVGSNATGVPRAQMAAYGASKAAATMFTRILGLEVAEHGIRCNIVSPGSTDTEMQRALWTEAGAQPVIDGDLAAHRVGIPLRRIADPADIADAVVFLASDQARHITMQNLYVDGGATLYA